MTPPFVLRTLVVIFLISSAVFSACLDSPGEEFLPPYQEEYSTDGGMYIPRSPETSSGYGSGYGSGASNYASGASEKSEFKNFANSKENVNYEIELDQGVADDDDSEFVDASTD